MTPPLADNGHKLAATDEIDACNDDLIVVITEVIANHTNPAENYMISPEIYLANPKTL